MQEIQISVDIEATGPIPGEFSVYQLGACVIKEVSENFYTEIKLLNENHISEALSSCGTTIEELRTKGIAPQAAMRLFTEWIQKVSKEKGLRPVFVAFNATFDWMFVHWYFHKFLGYSPSASAD